MISKKSIWITGNQNKKICWYVLNDWHMLQDFKCLGSVLAWSQISLIPQYCKTSKTWTSEAFVFV